MFEAFGGQKSDIFDRRCSKSPFRIVLPMRARSTFFKKCEVERKLDHKNHETCILKLAFLMQSRIKFHRTQLFCILLGEYRAKWKVTKSARRAFLVGRAECAGALGETFEGVRDLQRWDCKWSLRLCLCGLGSARQRLPTARAADRSATRIPPGQTSKMYFL